MWHGQGFKPLQRSLVDTTSFSLYVSRDLDINIRGVTLSKRRKMHQTMDESHRRSPQTNPES